jgi:hypothetical protein
MKVVELINVETKRWKKWLIMEIFLESESQVILNIPLFPLQSHDSLIWRCTTNILFLVRSAYHMEKELQSINRCGGSSPWKSDQI